MWTVHDSCHPPRPDDAMAEASVRLHGTQRECSNRLLNIPPNRVVELGVRIEF